MACGTSISIAPTQRSSGKQVFATKETNELLRYQGMARRARAAVILEIEILAAAVSTFMNAAPRSRKPYPSFAADRASNSGGGNIDSSGM